MDFQLDFRIEFPRPSKLLANSYVKRKISHHTTLPLYLRLSDINARESYAPGRMSISKLSIPAEPAEPIGPRRTLLTPCPRKLGHERHSQTLGAYPYNCMQAWPRCPQSNENPEMPLERGHNAGLPLTLPLASLAHPSSSPHHRAASPAASSLIR